MRLFVGCSSSDYIDNRYIDDCRKLLEVLLDKCDLVFGASDTGLMGYSYEIAKKNGRKVIGACPKIYRDDFKKLECDIEIVTDTVNERTNALIKNCDAMIFLPGGVGTIYELFSCIESKRSHEYDKPIIIYNSYGYFDDIFKAVNKAYFENFSDSRLKSLYSIVSSYQEVLEILKLF